MKPLHDATASLLRRWRRKKVTTLPELMEELRTSLRTLRRRLKEWGALASYNHNSRFYTLPELPQFDEHGLWFERDIGFSRHGHLPQTIVALVRQSPGGLTAAQLGQRLRMDPRSFLWQFHQHPDLRREKHQGHYVYFAADPAVATRQRAVRSAALAAVTLPSAAEAIWRDPATGRVHPSEDLRRLVAPGCRYGYDVLVEVGRKLFVEAQPVRQILTQLARRHVHLSASTVSELGRRFIVLLALAHRRCASRLQQAMSLQGGYILHLDATYEDKSPMLMSGIDAVMEIVLGNIKLPSEKADGIVPFLRQLKRCFGPPLACVHDMSKGILAAIQEVFPGVPDFICHFHFLRDLGKDLFGAEYDTVRKRLQAHATLGRLRARLRTWQKRIDADLPLRAILEQLPVSGWPAGSLSQAPLLAAYVLAHWILAGLQQGQGYGFPFDRPLLALARRAQEVHAHLQSLICLSSGEDWRRNLPFHHLGLDLRDMVNDRPLGHTLDRLETHSQLFDQLRQALRIAPVSGNQGLNHEGDWIEMKTLQRAVQAFSEQVRARPDCSTTPAFQKMLEQIDRYGPKLFAAPLTVSTPRGARTIQPQRTNNLMERFFRDFKRQCRHKSGCHTLGRTLRAMLADTTLVHNLQKPEYLTILLDGQPSLEALFAQIDPATVRDELQKAQQNPDRVPRALKRFIAALPSPAPIKNFIRNLKSNRLSRS